MERDNILRLLDQITDLAVHHAQRGDPDSTGFQAATAALMALREAVRDLLVIG